MGAPGLRNEVCGRQDGREARNDRFQQDRVKKARRGGDCDRSKWIFPDRRLNALLRRPDL